MHTFVDLDGTLADFFPAVEARYDVPSYKLLTTSQYMDLGKDINFWKDLEKTHCCDELIRKVVEECGSYSVLSTPILGSMKCIKGKLFWITKNLTTFKPRSIYLTDRKYTYAKGNILVDDFRGNINTWEMYGGYGIKFKASSKKKTVADVVQEIRRIKNENN